MAQTTAAVVDLDEFRRRKRAQLPPPRRALPGPQRPIAYWMVWVPVWIVA